MKNNGYYGIGVENMKNTINYGTLFRSAVLLGAGFIFLIGKRFKRQASDTVNSHKRIPLYEYETFEDFYAHIPHGCILVGIELTDTAKNLVEYTHQRNCIYLLGSEDKGLSKEAMKKCHDFIKIPMPSSLNVATTGSIVMYDRLLKQTRKI